MARNSALWLDVLQDLQAARRSVEWAQQQADLPPPTDADARFARDYTIGGMIHNCYGAIERALERIVLSIDERLPEGGDHHRELVLRASREMAGMRPPIVSKETAADLDRLRRFRHAFRHVYDEYDYGKAEENVAVAARVVIAVRTDLGAFAAALGVHLDDAEG